MNVKKAFTLMEIIIVIIILGIIAGLAMPKVMGSTEQAIVSEGVSFLETLNAAQKRYELEHGTGVFTNNCANLDVDNLVPKNFNTVTCTAAGSVSVTRIGGPGYTITETIAGVFSCAPAASCTRVKLPT